MTWFFNIWFEERLRTVASSLVHSNINIALIKRANKLSYIFYDQLQGIPTHGNDLFLGLFDLSGLIYFPFYVMENNWCTLAFIFLVRANTSFKTTATCRDGRSTDTSWLQRIAVCDQVIVDRVELVLSVHLPLAIIFDEKKVQPECIVLHLTASECNKTRLTAKNVKRRTKFGPFCFFFKYKRTKDFLLWIFQLFVFEYFAEFIANCSAYFCGFLRAHPMARNPLFPISQCADSDSKMHASRWMAEQSRRQ